MFVGHALETLRGEAPLHAASTPPVDAALAVGYDNDVGEYNEAIACTPRLGLQREFVLRISGRCCISARRSSIIVRGTLIPSLRRGIVKKVRL